MTSTNRKTARKRSLAVAGMALLAAGAASAQSNVQLYGVVDAGVEYINRVGGSGSLMRMPTVTSASCLRGWGFAARKTWATG